MQVVVPMCGTGRRFREAGYEDPKPLIEVDGRPMLSHVFDLFPGETNIHCICNETHIRSTGLKEAILRYCPTAKIHQMNIPRGPVEAVLRIAGALDPDDELIITYCDYGTEWDYESFLRDCHEHAADGAVACYTGFHPHMLGTDNYAFVKHQDMWLQDIQEKRPFTDNRMGEYASNGTYYFRRAYDFFEYGRLLVQNDRQIKEEFYVSMVYKLMAEDHKRIRVFEIQSMLQWGTPKDLEEYKLWSACIESLVKKPMKFRAPLENVVTILPMAGSGSRFKMAGYQDPKPLLPVDGLPMVIRAVKDLPPTSRTVFITLEEHLKTYPGLMGLQKYISGAEIYEIPSVTQGQACTCEIAMERADISNETPVLISACDNGAYYEPESFYRLMADPSVDVVVWSFTNNPTARLYPQMYAWLDVDEELNLREVSVKKTFPDRPNIHAIIGTMFFRSAAIYREGLKEIYRNDIRANGEFYVDNILNELLRVGYRIKVFPVDYYLCWGTPNDYRTYLYWRRYHEKRLAAPIART